MSTTVSSTENQLLLHIIKHNPRHGEVYITWEGETFKGQMNDIEMRRAIDSVTSFTISGYIEQ